MPGIGQVGRARGFVAHGRHFAPSVATLVAPTMKGTAIEGAPLASQNVSLLAATDAAELQFR